MRNIVHEIVDAFQSVAPHQALEVLQPIFGQRFAVHQRAIVRENW
ncbi:MAG: hypothetical protein ACKOFA_02835 [Rhodoluna sp.]